MKDFEEFLRKVKKSSDSLGEKYEIRIPQPDKEWAKQNGAKWDDSIKSFVFYSDNPNSHALGPYIKSSKQWLLIPKKLPYDSDGVLRRAGVVSEKLEDQWVNYVLGIEKYAELIGTLNLKGYL
jgi:hypothetical protein